MFSSAGMPIVVIMLLVLATVLMTNPKATFLSMLCTVLCFALYHFAEPYIPVIPSDYLVIAIVGCVFGAFGMILLQKVIRSR